MPGTGVVREQHGRLELYAAGQCVARGDADAIAAAAQLLGITGRLCVTPSGRFDGHGVYVSFSNGRLRCMFCNEPLDADAEGAQP